MLWASMQMGQNVLFSSDRFFSDLFCSDLFCSDLVWSNLSRDFLGTKQSATLNQFLGSFQTTIPCISSVQHTPTPPLVCECVCVKGGYKCSPLPVHTPPW